MKTILLALIVALLVAFAFGQGTKLAGSWDRTSCECSSPSVGGTCDALWQDSYDDVEAAVVLGAPPGETGYEGVGDDATRPLRFSQNTRNGISTVVNGVGYECKGVMGKEIKCMRSNLDGSEELACTVTFTCRDGDCIGSVVQQNMRSIGYPVIAIILGALWFIWPIIGGIVPSKLFAIALSGAVFGLSIFLLFVPPLYMAILLMAVAAYAFNAVKAGGSFEIKVAMFGVIFAALMMWGLNFLAAGFGASPWFEQVMAGFNNDSCYLYYGVDYESERCRQYALFAAILGYFVSLLLPLLAIALLWVLVQEEEGK